MEHTIPAKDLDMVLAARRAARHNGNLAKFCIMSRRPIIEIGCRCSSHSKLAKREAAARFGLTPGGIQPMERGQIGELYERVKAEHGRATVVRTWGTGIRALRGEPRFTFKGPQA